MSLAARWLSLVSFSLALLLGPACSCAVQAPGTDGGPTGPKPQRDGGDPLDDAGPNGDDAGPNGDDAGPNGDDAGPNGDDAGSNDDAGSDAGPNAAPSIGSFTSSADTVDDPGTVTLTVVATDADGDALEYTYAVVGSAPTGITFAPAGPTEEASTTVSFDGTVPRGSYTIEVTVSDGEDTAIATVVVTVNNHAPTLSVEDVAILPDSPAASVTLAPLIDDVDLAATPADTLTVGWVTPGSLPEGVTFEASDPLAPTVTVDRATYEPDPAQVGFQFTVTVGVSDDEDASAVETLTITVLDERGGHVDNTSPYAGTGPAGYCGSQAHPCATLADAQANLASLRLADASVPNELRVATTGTDYALDDTLTLDDGVALRCGFDADALDDVTGEWAQTAERTPLRSTAATGITVRDTNAAGVSSSIERCDVEMIAPANEALLRVGIDVDAAGLTLSDSRVLGSTDASDDGIAVYVHGASTSEVLLEDNDIDGGAALNAVVGVAVTGRAVTLVGNDIEGGVASKRAVGVSAGGADVEMRDHERVVGGDAELAAGVVISGQLTAGSTLDNVTATGREGTGGVAGYGVIMGGAGELSNNALSSGPVPAGAALLVDGAVSVQSIEDVLIGDATQSALGVEVKNGASVTLTAADVSAPGNGNPLLSTGLEVSGGATLTVVDSSVNAGPAQYLVVGAEGATDATALTLSGTHVSAGNATLGLSAGIAASGGALLVEGSDAVTNPVITAGAASDSSLGISADCAAGVTTLQLEDLVVDAGDAANSIGIRVNVCTNASLRRNVVTAGTATTDAAAADHTGSSVALVLDNGSAVVEGGSYTGGPATRASAGVIATGGAVPELSELSAAGGDISPPNGAVEATSAGVALIDAGAGVSLTDVVATGGAVGTAVLSTSYGVVAAGSGTLTKLAIDGGTLASGTAEDRAAGLWVEPSFASLTIHEATLTSDQAGSSGALVLRAGGAEAVVEDSVLLASEATGGATIDSVAVSVGLWMQTCEGCFVQRNVIEGGAVSGNTGRSLGVRIHSRTLASTSYLTNNIVAAGEAGIARALEVSGDAGSNLRVLHNNLYGGGNGAPASKSAAVYMGQVPPANDALGGNHAVASFGGNIIDPGVGDTRVGFWETCVVYGGLLVHTVGPAVARNSNFWPSVGVAADVVYVRDASAALALPVACVYADRVTLADVNGASIYGATNGGGCSSQSFEHDPSFVDGVEVDGVIRAGTHIAADSPLHGGAPGTYANDGCASLDPLWGEATDMTDIDGDTRPSPAADALDIGADEVP